MRKRAPALTPRLLAVAVLGALFGVITPTSASSAPVASKRITGTLNKSGYTVIALGYNGKVAMSTKRSFSLVAPDSKVTLQLVGRNGLYAGPVVVAGSGPRVIVGFKAGAALGAIKVLGGYARTARSLGARFLDPKRFAQAHRGVPIGNGKNLGLVRSTLLGGSTGPGGDYDHVGVPNVFNVANRGNLILNNLEPAGGASPRLIAHIARASASVSGAAPTNCAGPTVCASGFGIFSQILVFLEQSVNADASTITTAQIDSNMANLDGLYMGVVPGDTNYLDCPSLSYCKLGGTGHLYAASSTGIQQLTPGESNNFGPAFPQCCDPNASGLGNLKDSGETPPSVFALAPGADSGQIKSGDVLIQQVTTAGVTTDIPAMINFVFATDPAIERWSSGSDSATVTYPVAQGGPGTQANPWPIGGGTGDVTVTFTYWRPQRSGIPGAGEPTFMDIGRLSYHSDPFVSGGSSGQTQAVSCPASSYSSSDPNLDLNFGTNSLVDQATDAPASSVDTLTYSLDLTACFAASGVSLVSGNVVTVNVSGRDAAGDNSGQNVSFKLR